MTKIVACVNLKGGVGKTALAVNFAAYCGRKGMKTLLIDLDPQTNATFSCIEPEAWKTHAKKNGTVADLLGARRHNNAEGSSKDAKSVIRKAVFPKVDLVPSHLDLFTVDLDLAGVTARERRLEKALRTVLPNYEMVVCDCPPNLTIPTQNALAMATHYMVPISPDYLSALGVALLVTRVKELCESLERDLDFLGIVISRVGRPAEHRTQMVATLRSQFKEKVLKQVLSERVEVSKAASKQKSIFDMDDTTAAEEFSEVSEEILRRLGKTSE